MDTRTSRVAYAFARRDCVATRVPAHASHVCTECGGYMRLKCAPAQGALRVARMGQYYSLNPATRHPQWSRATLNGVEDTMGPRQRSTVQSKTEGSEAHCPCNRAAIAWTVDPVSSISNI